jgi:beta-lactamase superfamily II metal-dependent hydrolase
MQLRFIGCGDALGSGGRANTCFHVTGESVNFLIDCGASSLPALKRFDVARDGIDVILITHFHGDHMGGAPELAAMMPIRNFIDHGGLKYDSEKNNAETVAAFNAYASLRDKGRHLEPKPGDRLPLKGIEATVVSSAEATLTAPLKQAAGQDEDKNAACSEPSPESGGPNENPRSTGVVVRFGRFRFLDVGDLTAQPLFNLVCPKDLIGPVDTYLVAHHGGADAVVPATFAAFKPRVAIMNNGEKKGGALAMYQYLHQVPGLEGVWQLHRSEAAGEQNFAEERIANLDERTAHWLKLSANEDGSFRVLNGRTREWTSYSAR